MNQQKKYHFLIDRFDPAVHQKPFAQEFYLEASGDLMLLKALIRLKEEQDESLSFRRSCGEGVCGSDGMQINGHNGLACVTPLSSLSSPIRVKPLPGLPIVRDLIVDMDMFYQQYEKVDPYLRNSSTPPAGERLQTPEQRAKLDGLYECILCGCCSTACPSYWWNPDKFIGPAGLLQAYRFIVDSRDTTTHERLDKLGDPYSVFRCRGVMSCTSSCPKGLNPAAAITDLKKQLL